MNKKRQGDLIAELKEKKHKDGAVTFELKCSTKQKNHFYKLALRLVNLNKIGMKDLLYQVKYAPNISFKDAVIAALIKLCTTNHFKKKKVKDSING